MQNIHTLFDESTKEMLAMMAQLQIADEGKVAEDVEGINSYGVASIIHFVGKIKGRLFLDMEIPVAIGLADKITGQSYHDVKEEMVLATVSEINNIIAGDVITKLNNLHSLDLRLTPPVVFVGNNTIVSIPKITTESLNYNSDYGKIKLNIAIEGEVK